MPCRCSNAETGKLHRTADIHVVLERFDHCRDQDVGNRRVFRNARRIGNLDLECRRLQRGIGLTNREHRGIAKLRKHRISTVGCAERVQTFFHCTTRHGKVATERILASPCCTRGHGHGGSAAELCLKDVTTATKGCRDANDCHHNGAAPEDESVAEPVDRWLQGARESRHHDWQHWHGLGVETKRVEAQEHLRHYQAGSKRAEYADSHDERKALHFRTREPVQHHHHDQVRHIAVDDGRARAAHGGVDGIKERLFAIDQFFAKALVNEHVAVYGDTQVQRDTGEAGQRKAGINQRHGVEDDQGIHQERNVRDDSWDEVVKRHDGKGGRHRDQHAVQSALQVVLTHGRSKDADGDGFWRQSCTERARCKDAHEVINFLLAEVATDLAAVIDLGVEVRRGIDLIVQHDGHRLSNIGAGETAHLYTARVIKLKTHGNTPEFVAGTTDALHGPFLAAWFVGQAAVWGDPEQNVDGLVRSGARGQTPA